MDRLWKLIKSHANKIIEENIEYRIFPIHFFVLTLAGLWYPRSITSSIRFVFKISLSIVIFMEIIGGLETGFCFLNSFDFVGLFFSCVTVSGCYKSARFFQKRKIVIAILEEYSNEKLLKNRNSKEETIFEKSKIEIRFEHLQFFIS